MMLKKVLKAIVRLILGTSTGFAIAFFLREKEVREEKEKTTKYLDLFRVMNQYVITKQRGLSVYNYLNDLGIRHIAVYGMSHIGLRLIDDLRGTDIKVLYGIDKRSNLLTYELPIYSPEENVFPEVDAILVTAYDFDEIEEQLEERTSARIINFNDMIFELQR